MLLFLYRWVSSLGLVSVCQCDTCWLGVVTITFQWSESEELGESGTQGQ